MIDFFAVELRVTNSKTYLYGAGAMAATIFLANLAIFLWLQDTWGGLLVGRLILTIVGVAVLAVLYRAARASLVQSPHLARAWMYLAASQLMALISGGFRSLMALGAESQALPAMIDGMYLLSLPLFLLGILSLPGKRQPFSDCVKMVLDLSSVLAVLVLGTWVFFIGPLKTALGGLPLWTQLAGFAYLGGALLLVFGLLLLLFRWPMSRQQAPYVWLALATGLIVVKDFASGIQILAGTYTNGGLLDLGQIGAALLLGLAGTTQWMMMHRKLMGRGSQPEPRAKTGGLQGGWFQYLPYGFLLGAYLLIPFSEHYPMPMSFLWLSVCVGGIIGLVSVRQVVTLRENNHLAVKLVAVTGLVDQQVEQLQAVNQSLLSEIESRKQVEERLLHDTLHDPLTGLPNRTLYMDRLRHAIEYGKRNEHYRFAMLFLDLDHFKAINEVLGHAMGDRLLVMVSERLGSQVRASDMVARLVGDEFIILLEGIQDLEAVEAFALRILDLIKVPFEMDGHQIIITASIGVVAETSSYDNPEDIVRDADIAMYQAKAEGKGRYQVFHLGLRDQVLVRVDMENGLHYALERGELQLHYQPIHALESEEIIGFEALLRWNHPIRGQIQPVELIAIAEENGLIIPIGRWVLENACRQLREWQEKYPRKAALTMNVNISSTQLGQPDFVNEVERILVDTGLDGNCLRLEITESICLQNPEALAEVFMRLDRLGIQLQIDDFGTGYSALSYLQNYPIRAIKIDRAFIGNMGDEGCNGEIVRTIIGLAHGLGMGTVAEGIETQAQLVNLRGYGCNFGQGFHLSLPMNGEAAEGLLNGNTIGKALGC